LKARLSTLFRKSESSLSDAKGSAPQAGPAETGAIIASCQLQPLRGAEAVL
jgi:hypothetical protein